jgi:hypothetical protein
MAGNHLGLLGRQLAFHNVEIGAADTASAYSQKNMARLGLRICNFSDSQRAF